MERDLSRERAIPEELRAELDRSRADLAVGRLEPLGPVLAGIHSRASRRIERKAEDKEQGQAKRS